MIEEQTHWRRTRKRGSCETRRPWLDFLGGLGFSLDQGPEITGLDGSTLDLEPQATQD